MSKPNLILIKNLDKGTDEVTEEFKKLVESMPAGTQFSMFDIIEHDEITWFTKRIKELEDEND